jgi:hypothetical protein
MSFGETADPKLAAQHFEDFECGLNRMFFIAILQNDAFRGEIPGILPPTF